MSIADRLSALGRGAAQTASGGWVDELYPKILDSLPGKDDGTGIPREYASGSAENDYKNEYRADDQSAAAKYPTNYAVGQLAGSAPAMIASAPLGVGGAVGMGALQSAGSSTNTGAALAKDTVRGGALGGALSSAGNLARTAAPAVTQAWSKLMQGPPGGPTPAPALAGAAAPAPLRSVPQAKPQVNMAEGGGGLPARTRALPPPRPNTADLHEVMPSTGGLAEEESRAMKALEGRDSIPPVDASKPLPKNPAWKHFNGVPDEEVDALEQRLRQTEASGQKRLEAKFQNAQNPPGATVRPPRRAAAGKAQAR